MAFRFGSLPEIEIKAAAGAMIDPGKYYSMLGIIDYTLEEHPSMLQRYYWGFHDIAPEFPKARGFSKMWREKVERAELFSANFIATPLFASVTGRSYQVDLRSIPSDRFAPVMLDARKTRELRDTGKTWGGKGLVLLH